MSTPPLRTRIAVVDDHSLMLGGMLDNIRSHGAGEVVLACHTPEELKEGLLRTGPVDVAVVDVYLRPHCGVELMEWLRAEHPATKVLAISFDDTDRTVLRVMAAGARGLVLKGSRGNPLVQALHHLEETGHYRTDHVEDCLRRNPDGLDPEERQRRKALEGLSERERQVVRTLLRPDEPTNECTALELGISKRTVDTHCTNIQQKMGVRTRTGLALRAVFLGLLDRGAEEHWRTPKER